MLKVCLKILFSVMTIILFNVHAYADEDFQYCSLIEGFEQTPNNMKLMQILEKRNFKPFLLIANNTYDCPCLLESRIGGDSDTARIGGDSDTARIGGDSDTARIGGDSDTARIGGDSDTARIGGDSDTARIGGDSDTARIGGNSDTARIGGDSDTARIGGNSDTARIGGAFVQVQCAISKTEPWYKLKNTSMSNSQIIDASIIF